MALLALKVQRDRKDPRAWLASKDHKALPELTEPRARKDLRARLAPRVWPGQTVLLVLRDQQDHRVLPGQMALQ